MASLIAKSHAQSAGTWRARPQLQAQGKGKKHSRKRRDKVIYSA